LGLADALVKQQSTKRGPACSVCTLLSRLPKADREALQAALDDKSYTGTAIARALQSEGHNIRSHTLVRHRNKECQNHDSV